MKFPVNGTPNFKWSAPPPLHQPLAMYYSSIYFQYLIDSFLLQHLFIMVVDETAVDKMLLLHM